MRVDRGDGAATRASVSASTADVRETAWMHRDHGAVCVMTTTRPGIVLNAEDRAKGRTELMCAAAGGHTSVISAILNHEPGVDLEAKDNEQESTAVLYAALFGQSDPPSQSDAILDVEFGDEMMKEMHEKKTRDIDIQVGLGLGFNKKKRLDSSLTLDFPTEPWNEFPRNRSR